MKQSFSILDINKEVLLNCCKTADDFATCWKFYLENNGWTEHEFELELEKQMFKSFN